MTLPWKKGIQGDEKNFVIEIHVKTDSRGTSTFRTLQDNTDEYVVSKLPNSGLEHASFALMQEAMRQEAWVQVLTLLTRDRELDTEVLKSSLTQTFSKMWETMSEDIINLTIESISGNVSE